VSDRSKTITIVDDKADIRLALRIALSARGFDVVEAESAEEALKKLLADTRPDIIFLDVNMLDVNIPGLAGLHIRHSSGPDRLRESSSFPPQTSETGEAEALSAGADGYIGKSFSIEELMLRIRATRRIPFTVPPKRILEIFDSQLI
jgi:two-component system, OmpR family, KDP operon response regulator KdpE